MTILALEFSSARRSVAVLVPGAEPFCAVRADAERSTHAFELIERVLQEAGLERRAIDCIAVGLGPGSYTGIRVGIAIAQGWQLAAGVRLLGVSSADAIAAQARAAGVKGKAFCLIDAQRREYYLGAYDLDFDPPRAVEPLAITSASAVSELAARGETLIGPEPAVEGNRLIYPDAATLARLASLRTDFVPGERLEPIYLRETAFVKAAPPRFQILLP
ncbi:MAG: tRNA (adenosine(37)-N6)-threonylcarbamoyltransferase complex dimerization subunit type 1 TsaB [Verrucomicrobia subdivision 3 bacterium]|nr:tRNA (adenosine(37)-N6)-threonylcarbamoyltransferase complex dimerization subunit type 1 TsaB [Limisphaerales bacterium]